MTDDKVEVGALISSYFNEPGCYFATFRFPDIDIPHSEDWSFSDDGSFPRMMGSKAATLINNAIAALQPGKVFLAGLSEAQKSYMYAFLPARMAIEVDSEFDVDGKLAFLRRPFDGVTACRRDQIIQGLLVAKSTNTKLTIDDAAAELHATHFRQKRGLVLIENDREAEDVVALNYAFSIDADVVLAPRVARATVDDVQRQIQQWKVQNSNQDYSRLRRQVLSRVGGIRFSEYHFATFFTRGLPYGLVLRNIIPFTHVLKNIRADLFVFNNIVCQSSKSLAGSAVVFSPKEFEFEETEAVLGALASNGFYTKPLIGSAATVNNLDNYGAHFPYDLLHICSHGGETDGYTVTQSFVDRKGKRHTIEYDEVVGFSPTAGERVRVMRKLIFKKFDGLIWRSAELRRRDIAPYVWEDLKNSLHIDEGAAQDCVRTYVGGPINASCHIKCFDSIHQGNFHSLAAFHTPVIFNNTCSSWHEMAKTLVDAGARAYIGTAWSIDNSVAVTAASTFYQELLTSENVMRAFKKMGDSVMNSDQRDIYILCGLHFSTLPKPLVRREGKVLEILIFSLSLWMRKYKHAYDPEVRRNCVPILNFLSQQVRQRLTPDQLMVLQTQLGFRIQSLEALPEESPGKRCGEDAGGFGRGLDTPCVKRAVSALHQPAFDSSDPMMSLSTPPSTGGDCQVPRVTLHSQPA